MRSLSAAVCGVVAVVAALLTVPALWVSAHVAQEDGYVSFSSALATDAELQGAFAAYLTDDFVQRGVLPDSLQKSATTVLTQVARGASNQPGFVAAWEETQRSFHRSAFAGDESGPLTVEVAPLAEFVTKRVGDRLPVSLTVSSDLVVPVGTSEDRRRLEWVDRSTTLGLLGLLVVVVGAAAAVMSARSRAVAFAWLGIGAIAIAGVLHIATSELAPKILDQVSASSPFARTLQELLVDRAASSLDGWLLWLGIGGAAVTVAAVATRVLTGRSHSGEGSLPLT